MKRQDFLVAYIIIHIIPAYDWIILAYRDKKQYHYIVSVGGRVTPMNPLHPADGCIEVAYAGSKPYAGNSIALFSLLLELWQKHPEAKIVYAEDLYSHPATAPILTASRWLAQHMPEWL